MPLRLIMACAHLPKDDYIESIIVAKDVQGVIHTVFDSDSQITQSGYTIDTVLWKGGYSTPVYSAMQHWSCATEGLLKQVMEL